MDKYSLTKPKRYRQIHVKPKEQKNAVSKAYITDLLSYSLAKELFNK